MLITLADAGKLSGATALEVDFARTTGAGKYTNVNILPDWTTFTLLKKMIVGNVPVAEIGDGSNTTPTLVGFEIVPIADETTGEINKSMFG